MEVPLWVFTGIENLLHLKRLVIDLSAIKRYNGYPDVDIMHLQNKRD